MKERGHFHVDQMYGSGSGVLIRFEGIFFLLTARHVILNNIPGEFQNESPFWISAKFQGQWDSLHSFLFPKFIWNIGELIKDTLDPTDASDVCLVELFHPQQYHQPDHFIEIRDRHSVLTREEHFEGQFLLVSGYPFEQNEFHFDPIGEYTHSTSLNRHTIPGIFSPEKPFGFISFDAVDADIQHENVTGMSGGVVCNVQPKANQVKLAGIPVSAGDNKCRFIPAYVFIDAILNYKNSSCRVVDPISAAEVNLDDILKLHLDYLHNFGPENLRGSPEGSSS
ncbi:hypothetical protein GmRootA79_46300 [Acidovorax sp. A79]